MAIAAMLVLANRHNADVGHITSEQVTENDSLYEHVQNLYKEDYTDGIGIIYDSISDNFDIKVYPVTIEVAQPLPDSMNNGSDGYRINYKISVYNKSANDYPSAHLIVTLDKQMIDFIASEVMQYPMASIDFTSVASKNDHEQAAHVLSAELGLMLNSDFNHFSKEEIFKEIQSIDDINIKIAWDNGEEAYDLAYEYEQ